jgi:hypothetical protein
MSRDEKRAIAFFHVFALLTALCVYSRVWPAAAYGALNAIYWALTAVKREK